MPQCNHCHKKGLFLKIEEDSGLCLACNEAFSKEGKVLTEKIMQAKAAAGAAKEKDQVVKYCNEIETYGEKLISLHRSFNLDPSQELQDLISTYKKMREMAAG